MVVKKGISDVNIIWIHIIIAFLSLIGYKYLSEEFKLLIAPYIIFMVLSENPKYLPSLVVHFMPGTSISFLILIACLLVTLKHSKKWIKTDLKLLYLLSISLLPIYFIQTYIRMLDYKISLVELVLPMDMYLGIFPFFYGILVYRQLNIKIIKIIIIILIISFVINFSGFYDETIRYVFFVFPLISSLFTSYFLFNRNKRYPLLSIIIFAIFIIMMLTFRDQTLTILLTSFTAFIIIVLYYRKSKISIELITSPWIFILTIGIVFYVINYLPTYSKKYSLISPNREKVLDINNLENLPDKILYKTFEDRAIIWSSVVNNIINEKNIFPPIFLKEYYLTTISGFNIKTELSAHNIFIEIIRKNGILSGLILSIIYIIMITKSSYKIRLKNLDKNLVSLIATIISCGIFGGITGQYPLIVTFSFMFMSIVGIVAAVNCSNNKLFKIKNTNC